MLWCFWLDTCWPFPGEKARVHRIFRLYLKVICSGTLLDGPEETHGEILAFAMQQ